MAVHNPVLKGKHCLLHVHYPVLIGKKYSTLSSS